MVTVREGSLGNRIGRDGCELGATDATQFAAIVSW
jgi:hypothetical protein